MFRQKTIVAILMMVLITVVAPTSALAQWGHGYHHRHAHLGFGYGYSNWGPYWGGPYWGGWYGPAYYPETTGDIKIKTKNKTALVYLDGGYLGPVHKYDQLTVEPG